MVITAIPLEASEEVATDYTIPRAGSLDDSAIGNHSILLDYNNATADIEPLVFPLSFLDSILVDDLYIVTNASILIDNCAPHSRIGTDTYRYLAFTSTFATNLRRLIVVGAHKHCILNDTTRAHSRTDT